MVARTVPLVSEKKNAVLPTVYFSVEGWGLWSPVPVPPSHKLNGAFVPPQTPHFIREMKLVYEIQHKYRIYKYVHRHIKPLERLCYALVVLLNLNVMMADISLR